MLDVTIYRHEEIGFHTAYFSKSFANTSPTHWSSCHTKFQKIGLLTQRGFRICSLTSIPLIAAKILSTHHGLFVTQGFPHSAVTNIFNKFYTNHYINIPIPSSPKPPKTTPVFVKQHFLPQFSHALSRTWSNISSILNKPVCVINKLNNNIYDSFKPKNTCVINNNMVYAIICRDCNNESAIPQYIGHTSRPIAKRLYSHTTEKLSPIYLHKEDTHHSSFTIIPLIKVNDIRVRIFVEANLINLFNPIWNQYDAAPTIAYASIMNKETKHYLKKHFTKIIKNYMSNI
jgi:hypothetical protein